MTIQKLGKSEPWKKYIRYKELATDGDILFYLKFEKSSLYKNYLDLKESFQLKRFYELKELTSSAEFLKRKEWLELGGAGMFRPEVTIPFFGKHIPVLAWGPGFDRIIMEIYNITDLRQMYANDINHLRNVKYWSK